MAQCLLLCHKVYDLGCEVAVVKKQRTLTLGEWITVQLDSSLARLDLTKEENMFVLLCSEAGESKLVKLETRRTVILPSMVSVPCEKVSDLT